LPVTHATVLIIPAVCVVCSTWCPGATLMHGAERLRYGGCVVPGGSCGMLHFARLLRTILPPFAAVTCQATHATACTSPAVANHAAQQAAAAAAAARWMSKSLCRG
jgi:hypothetical protein